MAQKTPVLAILALIFSIIFSPVGLILSIIALVKSNKDPEKTGQIISIVALVISLLIIPLMFMIMLGSLAYFGVLSPQKYLPERCSFSTPFVCLEDEYTISAKGSGDGTNPTVLANLVSNYKKDILVGEFEISTYDGVCSSYYICLDSDGDNNCNNEKNLAKEKAILTYGQGKTLLLDCIDGSKLEKGVPEKFSFNFTWRPEESPAKFSKKGHGEIYAKVQ